LDVGAGGAPSPLTLRDGRALLIVPPRPGADAALDRLHFTAVPSPPLPSPSSPTLSQRRSHALFPTPPRPPTSRCPPAAWRAQAFDLSRVCNKTSQTSAPWRNLVESLCIPHAHDGPSRGRGARPARRRGARNQNAGRSAPAEAAGRCTRVRRPARLTGGAARVTRPQNPIVGRNRTRSYSHSLAFAIARIRPNSHSHAPARTRLRRIPNAPRELPTPHGP
jgi:hypothetical protein